MLLFSFQIFILSESVALRAMHEENEMQKGRLSPGMSLVTVDVVDSVSSSSCLELLTFFTIGIAVW